MTNNNIVFKTELQVRSNNLRNDLDKHIGAYRFTWNHMLAETNKNYSDWIDGGADPKEKPSVSMQSLKVQWTNQVRPRVIPSGWHKELSSRPFRNACDNLAVAYGNFFSGRAEKPTFIKKGQKESFTMDLVNLLNGGRFVSLSKIGEIKLHERLKGADWLLRCGAELRSGTISKEPDGRYYISILIKADDNLTANFYRGKFKKLHRGVVGIDVGLSHFLTDSNGVKIDNPRFYRNGERKLAATQKVFSRKMESRKLTPKNENGYRPKTRSYEDARKAVARQHRKIANQRKDFLTKLAREYALNNETLVVESLSITNMVKNHCLAKSIQDASWGTFFSWLKNYMKYGLKIVEADRWFASSKTCSRCGGVKTKLSLSEHTFFCDDCGLEIDRDLNAACNLLQLVIKDAPRCEESLNGGELETVRFEAIDPRIETLPKDLTEVSRVREQSELTGTKCQ